jgi:hypothetical protein
MRSTFSTGKHYEVIVSTKREVPEGKGRPAPNAAAIGLSMKNDGAHFKVFEDSDTFENLRSSGWFGINVIPIGKIDLLARAALTGWASAEPEFEDSEYEYVVGFPFLKAASVQIVCQAEKIEYSDGSDEYGNYRYVGFRALSTHARSKDESVVPIERGSAPLLEALVLATRWRIAEGDGKKELGNRISSLIEKAGSEGNEAEKRAVTLIEGFMEK